MKTFQLSNKETIPFTQDKVDRSWFDFERKDFIYPIKPDAMRAKGYYGYIADAWNNHYGVVLNPTDIWYMILCELILAISKEPKRFSNLFTTTPNEKKAIVTFTNDTESIDPLAVIEVLKTQIPSNVDDFLPKFTTDTQFSRLAMSVAFCDMVSPYYNYWTLLCGIPKITIGGTEKDWLLITNKLSALLPLFKGTELKTYLSRCHSLVVGIITAIQNDAADYFKSMVTMERCGSGHQQDMGGWIVGFLNVKDFSSVKVENLHVHCSQMEYTNIDTNRTFRLNAGVLYSCPREDGFLIPEYSAYRIELTEIKRQKEEKAEANRKKQEAWEQGKITWVSSPVIAKTKKLRANWTSEDQKLMIVGYKGESKLERKGH